MLLAGVKTGTASMEISVVVTHKTRNTRASYSTPGHSDQRTLYPMTEIRSTACIAALITIARA